MGEEKIAALEAEVKALRRHCRNADGTLAYLIGILFGAGHFDFKVGIGTVMEANALEGWHDAILERFTAGQEEVREARRSGL